MAIEFNVKSEKWSIKEEGIMKIDEMNEEQLISLEAKIQSWVCGMEVKMANMKQYLLPKAEVFHK